MCRVRRYILYTTILQSHIGCILVHDGKDLLFYFTLHTNSQRICVK